MHSAQRLEHKTITKRAVSLFFKGEVAWNVLGRSINRSEVKMNCHYSKYSLYIPIENLHMWPKGNNSRVPTEAGQ